MDELSKTDEWPKNIFVAFAQGNPKPPPTPYPSCGEFRIWAFPIERALAQ